MAPTGKDAGLGKRALLGRNSILVLNKQIVDEHEPAWTETDIERRSAILAKSITEAWPVASHVSSTGIGSDLVKTKLRNGAVGAVAGLQAFSAAVRCRRAGLETCG